MTSNGSGLRLARGEHGGTGRNWRQVHGVALYVLLFLVAFQSARQGVAGLIVELGQREVDRWTASQQPQSLREISRVADYFSESLDYLPDNPWAHEALGALNLARMRLSTLPQQALAYAWAARLRFRQALQQRPSSPFLWANLALSKLYLDEIDAELFAALRHADELGPWEPGSQLTVLFVGLAAWEKLDPDLRKRIVAALERGAARNSAKILETLKSFGRFDLICGMKRYHKDAAVRCRDGGATAQTGARVP